MDAKMVTKAVKLNISKCKVVSFGRHADKVRKYNFIDNDLVTPIERVETVQIWVFLWSRV